MQGIPIELLDHVVGQYDPSSGEWAMRCPHPDHEDTRRSASINVPDGVWYCHGCNEGGPVDLLVNKIQSGEWGDITVKARTQRKREGEALDPVEVARWHKFLKSKKFRTERRWLMQERGITRDTIDELELGYDPLRECYTIPVYWEGELQNVRRYDPDPGPEWPKMRNVKGHGVPVIWPEFVLDEAREAGQPVIVGEGEWDQAVARQEGLFAVTRTGGADTWDSSWNELFEGMDVILCHDLDDKGEKANAIVRTELRGVANSITTVYLPGPPESGYDLTDYFVKDGYTGQDFFELWQQSTAAPSSAGTMSVLESLDGDNYLKPSPMRARVVGVAQDQYSVPRQIYMQCGRDQDDMCNSCPMNALGGKSEFEIPAEDRTMLDVLYGPRNAERRAVINASPIDFDCESAVYVVRTVHSVSKVFLNQFFDHEEQDLNGVDVTTLRQAHIMDMHDITANTGIEFIGEQRVNPANHKSELVGWATSPIETDLDHWEMGDEEMQDLLEVFGANPGQVGKKLKSIARDMAEHVTHIYGRDNMHIMMDLVWHSVLRFKLDGSTVDKGWLDAIVVGETRTGKSEAASKMLRMYRRGEMVSLESSSLAGVLGGVQQMAGKEWVTTWGVVPMNDRGLVVLDEVSGFNDEEIGHMSSMRSSGVAELTKIRSDRTLARTRLLWIGNPRDSGIHYSSGIKMLQDLIGKPEDLARFDIAMSVHSNDPGTERANQMTGTRPERQYEPHMLQRLLGWAWSRREEDVVIDQDTTRAIFKFAVKLGHEFASRPPLVQEANVRVKLARVACAIAARTFSTDDGVQLIVRPDHVKLAYQFMSNLYNRPNFGYGDVSKHELGRIKRTTQNWDEAKAMLVANPELTVYLRSVQGHFSALELRNMASYSEFSAAVSEASSLYQMGFLDKFGEQYAMTKELNELLKEIPV